MHYRTISQLAKNKHALHKYLTVKSKDIKHALHKYLTVSKE